MIRRITGKVKRFWAAVALLSVEMIIVMVLFILAVILFIYLIRNVIFLNNTAVDEKIFQFLNTYVSDTNNEIIQFLTFLGSHNFLIPANLLLIAYFLFIKKHKWYSIKIPAIALSSLGLMFGLKYLFHRERPAIPLLEEAKGLSFPSGHALFSVTFYGLLIYIIFKTIKKTGIKWTLIALLIFLILIIGFTRIYLKVHYATDVLAGYCVGFLWLVIAIWFLNKTENFSRKKFVEVSAPPEK